MNDIREILEKVLSTDGRISFKVYYENGMREVNSSYDGEYSQVVDDWLGYGGLYNSIGNEYYDYDGEISIVDNEIIAQISFNGPYEGEFEPTEIHKDWGVLNDFFSRNLKKFEIDEIDPTDFYVSFYHSENEGFLEFIVNYCVESGAKLEINNLLIDEQLIQLKNIYKTIIHSNIPTLDIGQDVIQNWSAQCEENQLRYSMYTECIKFQNLDFSRF